MADHDGGTVRMQIRPSINATQFGREIKERLDGKVTEVGAELGRRLGKAMSQGAKAGFAAGDVVEAVRNAGPRVEAEAGRRGREAGREMARHLRAELEARLRAMRLPEASVRVRVELDERSFNQVRARLAGLGPVNVTINVDADTAAALARLAAFRAEADSLLRRGAQITVTANTAPARNSLYRLALQLAAITAVPVGTALAAGIGGIATAFVAATAGAVGFAAVAIPAVSKVREALQAHNAAQEAVNTSTSAGLNTADQARLRALQMVGAEQQLANAKAQARQAEEALTQARRDARRAAEDLTNQVKSGALAERRATLAVQEARQNLNKVLADPKATQLQREQAQLAVEEALQQLDEQRLATRRLREDKAAADRAGIAGSEQVRNAQQQLTQALQAVGDAQRNITAQRIQDAMAQRQAAAAAGSNSAAQQRLAQIMGQLSPAQRTLLRDWQAFSKTYRAWVRELEPDVLPVLSRGLDLVSDNLDRATPLVRGSAQAFTLLERKAELALDGPFWDEFLRAVGIVAPPAIVHFGNIFGHTFTGMAGVAMAFMPHLDSILGAIDSGAERFQEWGTSLSGSNGFVEFIEWSKINARIVWNDMRAIGAALLEIGQATAPVAALYLTAVEPLARGVAWLADQAPGLFQVGAALLIGARAARMLGITALVAGLTGTTVAAGAAGTALVRFGGILRTVGGAMMGVTGQAVTTRLALLGLARLGVVVAGVTAASYGIGKLQDEVLGTAQPTTELTHALIELGRSGQFAGALTEQFKAKLLTARTSVAVFRNEAKELVDPTPLDYMNHALSATVALLPGVTSDVERLRGKFSALDSTLVAMAQGGQAPAAAASFQRLSAELRESGLGIDKINKLFPQYTAMQALATTPTQSFTERLKAQNQALAANARAFMSSEQQAIDFQLVLNAGTEALNRNGQAFWGNSRAAIDNRAQVLNAARVLQRHTDELVDNNQVTDQNIKVLRKQREGLIEMAMRFGLSRKAAAEYVDQLVKIPKSTGTKVTVDAKGKFSIKGLDNLGPVTDILKGIGANAGGGYIAGNGGPRADDQLTRVSAGEMIINAAATAKHLPTLARWNDEGNAGTIYKGKGYAGGGIPKPASMWSLPGGAASWTPDGYAGGGIPKALTAPRYTRDYRYNDDAHEALAKATKANTRLLAGTLGYVSGQHALAATALTQLLGAGSGGKAVQFAVAQLGEPYLWGGTGPDRWDCSGLTQAAWRHAGVTIPRVTYDQIASGTPTTRQAALPGDLFFPHRGHVMMVTGQGGNRALIHAPRTGDVVRYAGWRSGGTYRHIGSGAPRGYGGGTPKAYARAQFGEFGWSASQWPPLDRLWQRESGWRWNARNPSSGAYGIPQALPPSKMASAGADWLTNWATQINWGLGYIQGRYGRPSSAWAHSQRVGWYARGTTGAAPGLAWVGEEGPELVRFKGGETVYPHEESMRIGAGIERGYASGTRNAWRTISGNKAIRDDLKNLVPNLTSTAGKIKSVMEDLAADIKKAFKGIRSTVDDRLISYLNKQSKALQNYANQRDKLASTITAAKEFATETGKNAREFAGLTGLPLGLQADSSGLYAEGEVFNAQGIIAGLKTRVTQLQSYKANLDKLLKLGVSKDVISQIIAAGPDRGAAYAAALAAATPAQVKELNSAQAAINSASTSVGQSAANAMYDAGSKAGQGFLSGLNAQKAEIEKAMSALAKSIRDRIKRDLKIKSPSQVMAELGEQIGQGLAVGIDSSLIEVQLSAERMGGLIVPATVPSVPALAPATGPAGRGGIHVEALHVHEVTDKGTKQAVTDALHDVFVLHRSLL
jgi:cell wall-associated NlpC family hydrolase